jgi:uncharacterized protein YutE (UPF0331/DUF86 family)
VPSRQWGLPDSLKAHFRILIEQRVIDPELGSRLQAMVGFRNIAVHEYERLDRDILKAILAKHLGDLEAFARAIKALVGASAS